jgi:hypothetical protein
MIKQQKLEIFESQKSLGFLRQHFCEYEAFEELNLVFCNSCGKVSGGLK